MKKEITMPGNRIIVPGIHLVLYKPVVLMFAFTILVGTAMATAGQEYDEISLISGKGLITHAEAAARAREAQRDEEAQRDVQLEYQELDITSHNADEISLISGKGLKIAPKKVAVHDSNQRLKRTRRKDSWIDVVDVQAEHKPVKHTLMHRFGEFIANKLNLDEPEDNHVPKKCQGAPSMITALLLQIFLGPLGAGFFYMARWDYACMCLGILFAPCILCFISCLLQSFCKMAERNPVIIAMTTLGVCSGCGLLAAQLWSIIMIANYSITCGGDYDGCDLSH